jgi:predicted metal-binding protein
VVVDSTICPYRSILTIARLSSREIPGHSGPVSNKKGLQAMLTVLHSNLCYGVVFMPVSNLALRLATRLHYDSCMIHSLQSDPSCRYSGVEIVLSLVIAKS